MDNKQKLIQRAERGDKEAQELLKTTYAELVFADLHLQLSLRMNKLAKKHDIYCRDEKKLLNGIKMNAEKLNNNLYNQLGYDSLAETFGNRSDLIQSVIKELAFMTEENLIKIQSECLIFNKGK